MSDEEQTQNRNDPVVIQLELRQDGSFQATGPLSNPILFLGMLEMAKQRLLSRMIQTEAQQAKAAEVQPRIYTPEGVRLHRS